MPQWGGETLAAGDRAGDVRGPRVARSRPEQYKETPEVWRAQEGNPNPNAAWEPTLQMIVRNIPCTHREETELPETLSFICS